MIPYTRLPVYPAIHTEHSLSPHALHHNTTTVMKIDYGQFIHALSDTIDLVGIDELQHGKRVAFMAASCCDLMGESTERKKFLYRAGLLHDCGVSSTKVHKKLVNELEWENSDTHCLIGAERLNSFAPLSEFSDITRYHHRRWQDLEKCDLPLQTKLDANLIFLLDRVDALGAMESTQNRLASRASICNKINGFRNTYFHPKLVDIFLQAAEREAFWITQVPLHLSEYIHSQQQQKDPITLDGDQLRDMARIFAQIVDAKSRFTAEHSAGVAKLAAYLANRCCLPEPVCEKIEVAALLHDIGKLQIPDAILDFDGGLEGESLALMRHHSYVTFVILNKIRGLEDISTWASNHHEKLDGSGYPFKRGEHEITIESRIIMVADIFQALIQNRPYRPSLPVEETISILQKMGKSNKIDRDIVGMIAAKPEVCYQKASTVH